MAALAPPYGATRTAVPALATTATGRARWRHSRTASPAHAAVSRPSTITRIPPPRRRPSSASQSTTHPAAAARAHSLGVATPTASSDSLAASGGGRNSRARRTSGARGVSRAAIAHATAALPSAPARYSVAPRLYQWAATAGRAAARAANESAAARRAPTSYNASALGPFAPAARRGAMRRRQNHARSGGPTSSATHPHGISPAASAVLQVSLTERSSGGSGRAARGSAPCATASARGGARAVV